MPIGGDFFERIREKQIFDELIHIEFAKQAAEFGMEISWNRGRAFDAYFQWMQDLERVEHFEEKVANADHLKCAAHLIYWLRRNSPINEFVHDAPADFRGLPAYTDIEFMLKYGREYLAFDLGYRAAMVHELNLNGRSLPVGSFAAKSSFGDIPPTDFIETVVHVLKMKNVSPHAIFLVLKAAFLRP